MKVLILAYDFPPYVSVGGLRPYGWYRYLGEFGVEPVVVTRQWANEYGDERDYIAPSATARVEVEAGEAGTVVRTPYTPNLANRLLRAGGPDHHPILRKVVSALYDVGQFYAAVGPKKELYRAARAYLRTQKVDAIVATGEPFVLFRYAALLSREFGIPWIADYRDPWSQDRRRLAGPLYRRWEAHMERSVTASASAITTVSDSTVGFLSRLQPRTPVHVIPNGYDPEAMAPGRRVSQGRERLTVAFVGSIYGWHPVESFFRVLDAYNREYTDAPVALRMIGVGGASALEESLRAGFPTLSATTTFLPRLANRDMAVELAQANAFLMFNNYRYTGTKVFDYLALGRHILLCYSDDPEAHALKERYFNLEIVPGADERVLEKLIRDTRSGTVVRDAGHLGTVLEELAREFREDGAIACASTGVERYSRRAETGRLADLIKKAAS